MQGCAQGRLKLEVTAWLIVPIPEHFQGCYPASRVENFLGPELMKLQSLRFHCARLARELGSQVSIGTRRYRVRGYLPSQFAADMRHEPYLAKPLGAAMASRAGPIVDVGVNKGQTLLRILSIDAEREYVGFEPQSACCALAQLFIKDNALRNAMVVGVALSDSDCLLPFYAVGSYDEMGTLDVQSRARYADIVLPQFVPARKGDGALQDLNVLAPAIIKVGVEGAELSVFQGLAETIARARPICFFEVLPNYMGDNREAIDKDAAADNCRKASAIFQFFRDAGYRIYQIDFAGEESLIDAFDLDNPATFIGSDYVAHPSN